MLTLIVAALLASIAFRRVAHTKGYATHRIQFYPVVILAAVIVPALCAELFMTLAVSHQLCSEVTGKISLTVINISCFLFYFGALSRSFVRLKKLPDLSPEASPPPPAQNNPPRG